MTRPQNLPHLHSTENGVVNNLSVNHFPQAPPNIVLILADDLGWVDTSFTGSRFYKTPNIERLARHGVFFPNAYSASPLCSPTRASIMTGQNPARVGITSPACHTPDEVFEATVVAKSRPTERQRGCASVTRLQHEYHTLAQALKDGGYVTGHFGKWHLGPEPYDPLHHGFDVDLPHWPGPGPAGSYVAPWRFPNFEPRTPNEHIEDRMGDEAVAFIEEHKEHPFFLNYWQFSVHAPFDAKEDVVNEYRNQIDPDDPQRCATYAAMVHSLDDNVGKILDSLDRMGLAQHTIIIFYSDNGGNMYDRVEGITPTSNAPLRGGKATMYEGGIRVPAIVVWPGVVEGGVSNETLIQSEDLYPTILEMAGIPPSQPCDGQSMVPALSGKEPLRDEVFCFFPHAPKVPDWLPPSVCVRQGDWKLIRIFHEGVHQEHCYELYHLKDDTGERHNLAAAEPDRVKALDALIDEFLADTKAVVPQPNPSYDPQVVESINGWQVGTNGQARISFDPRRQSLQFRAFSDASTLTVSEPLDLSPGLYRFEILMAALAGGDGMVSCIARGRTDGVIATRRFALQHDDKWREYQVELHSDETLTGLQLTPCTEQGTVYIQWIRLRAGNNQVIREWRFEQHR